jgi:hypothetical protein
VREAVLPSFVEFVAARVVRQPVQDVQVEGLILSKADASPQGRPNYLWLKDLVNPQQAYWDHVGEALPPSDELKARFRHGNKLHAKAGVAFAFVEGFAGSEVVLDGAATGVPGVRGKVDFRHGLSLVEFKTTASLVESAEDVWTKLPQDAEQLLFYAALWTYDHPEHYLVYHTEQEPPLRVFKITIKDRNAIKRIANQRREALQNAIKNEDPSKLEQCRYYGGTCSLGAAKKCACADLKPIDTSPLRDACAMERDPDMEGILATAFEEANSIPPPVTPWDLETPRRAYLKLRGEAEESDYEPHEFWAWRAMRDSGLLPGVLEATPIPRVFSPLHFKAGGFYIKRVTGHAAEAQTRYVPTLLRVKADAKPPTGLGLRNQIMQLGVLCALTQRETGILVVELPNAPAKIAAYQVSFKDLGGIRQEIRERLAQLKRAIDANDITQLPLCPSWLRDKCGACQCKDGVVNVPVKELPPAKEGPQQPK